MSQRSTYNAATQGNHLKHLRRDSVNQLFVCLINKTNLAPCWLHFKTILLYLQKIGIWDKQHLQCEWTLR